jgi:hypothetical protein
MGADAADEKTRYEAAKKELAQALKKKRELDKQLVRTLCICTPYFLIPARQSTLEVQLYHAEGTYLTETYSQGGGNIVHGFDNYLKNQAGTRRRTEVTEGDRLFSTSSATYHKVSVRSISATLHNTECRYSRSICTAKGRSHRRRKQARQRSRSLQPRRRTRTLRHRRSCATATTSARSVRRAARAPSDSTATRRALRRARPAGAVRISAAVRPTTIEA